MPALVPGNKPLSHHPATYGPGASPQRISAAREGRALLVQVVSGTVHLGGPDVSPTDGISRTAPGVFADSTNGIEWWAYVPDGASIYVDEIY